MAFNEDSRVKIPAILHLTRLGYSYLSLKDATWDKATNIFPELFRASIKKINPDATPDDIGRLLQEISLLLDNEDLGKAFYARLTKTSGLKLIDFKDFDKNTFRVVTLREELERLFRKKNLSEITQEEMVSNIAALNGIHARARELERRNQLLRAKYANDAKYARLHKRLMEKGDIITPSERKLFEALCALKQQVDERVSQNAQLLTNPPYTEAMMLRLVVEQLKTKHQLPLTAESSRFINTLVMKEYLDEFNGQQPA